MSLMSLQPVQWREREREKEGERAVNENYENFL